jgi:phosphatidylglycerophosphatase A
VNALARLVGTGFYTGYAPVASGTFGTIPGVLLALPLASLYARSLPAYLIALLVSFAVAVWSAERCCMLFESKDPSRVVADEMVGFLVTVAAIHPLEIRTLVVGFFLFRIFDILKPFPAGAAEALPGGYGVVVDDVVAGAYAFVCLRLLLSTGIV